ncbi:hypothetical protein DL96DRAFT_1598461 [Flagelloscypha sp. PMI_526]|nr:hypothetical protein DL96DRAFT_1598461 [Flagelloscypha sp. PMI_526]
MASFRTSLPVGRKGFAVSCVGVSGSGTVRGVRAGRVVSMLFLPLLLMLLTREGGLVAGLVTSTSLSSNVAASLDPLPGESGPKNPEVENCCQSRPTALDTAVESLLDEDSVGESEEATEKERCRLERTSGASAPLRGSSENELEGVCVLDFGKVVIGWSSSATRVSSANTL